MVNAASIYLTDGGAVYCGKHLGMTARMTGCDLSGQPILEVTPAVVAEAERDGEFFIPACETCGAVPSRLWGAK